MTLRHVLVFLLWLSFVGTAYVAQQQLENIWAVFVLDIAWTVFLLFGLYAVTVAIIQKQPLWIGYGVFSIGMIVISFGVSVESLGSQLIFAMESNSSSLKFHPNFGAVVDLVISSFVVFFGGYSATRLSKSASP